MKQRLFYAPVGATPIEIRGRKFRHPVTGNEIHNPGPNPEADILLLEREAPPPNDARYNAQSDSYVRSTDGSTVRMTWTTARKDAAPALPGRLQEVQAQAREVGDATTLGFTREVLDIALVYAAGGTIGPWPLPRPDGTWADLNEAELATLVNAYSNRMRDVLVTVRMHSRNLRSHAEANDLPAMLSYDIEAGWPT